MGIRNPLGKGLVFHLALVMAVCGSLPIGCARTSREAHPTRAPATATLVLASPPPATSTPAHTPTRTQTATPTTMATPSPVPTAFIPSPTSSPTATPAAVATEAPGPEIQYFGTSVTVADPGDVITLTWSTSYAETVLLYKLYYSGQLPAQGLTVPLSGVVTYTIPVVDRNWITLMLYAEDAAERHTMATTTVQLRCPDPWFFTPRPDEICPTAPLISLAAEQHFEGGTMIWVEAEDTIYVLYAGEGMVSPWNRFEDTWDESQRDRDPEIAPPPGLMQPIRGFGLVWREQPTVRDSLGWAIDNEKGFTTVVQRTTRYKYNAWYMLALDGGVWYLGPERSDWGRIVPDSLFIGLDD
jgi:hypothetical protein